jgi:hypothetical protein
MWSFQGSFIKPGKLNCQGKLASTILVDATVLCNCTSPTAADLRDVMKIHSLWFNYRYEGYSKINLRLVGKKNTS